MWRIIYIIGINLATTCVSMKETVANTQLLLTMTTKLPAENTDLMTTGNYSDALNYTEEILPLLTLHPNITLEEIDALLGPMGAECLRRAMNEYSEHIDKHIPYEHSLAWRLCRCWGVYCPNQTAEEAEKVIEDLVANNMTVAVEYDAHTIAAIVTYGAVIAVGVVGNALVLAIIAIVLRPISVIQMLICSLAVADFLVCSICVPIRLHAYVIEVWLHSQEACKTVFYLYFALFMCSVFTLTAISVERWFVTCFPLKAKSINTPRTAIVIIFSVWILGFLLAIPVAIHSRKVFSTCVLRHREKGDWSGPLYLYMLVAIFLLPSVIMGAAYFHTSVVLWKSSKKTAAINGINGHNRKASNNEARSRVKMIVMLIIVWIIFVFCWGPFLLFNVLVIKTSATKEMPASTFNHLYRALNLLTMANSAVNPILYAFLYKKFQQGFVALMTCQPFRTHGFDLKSEMNGSVSQVTVLSATTATDKV